VARGDTTLVIATAGFGQRRKQRLVRTALVQIRVNNPNDKALSG
jgi:hypothetical protein